MQMKSFMGSTVTSFINLFFPNACAGCSQPLSIGEEVICVRCRTRLPYTWFHLSAENPVEKMFTGRVPVEAATACFFFRKDSVLQNIIHQFKYQSRTDIARYMGRQMGMLLADSPVYRQVDALVPVPLHYTKKKKRGYNQSELLCEGMAEILQLPVCSDLIKRVYSTESQTHKSRIDRWQNVRSAFITERKPEMQNRHLLLVDDVITTGATLEACTQSLMALPGIKISVAALALARY
jgi:ComF family protein